MLAFCAALRESAETAVRLKDASGRSVDCFMEDVDARVRGLSGGAARLPLPPDQFASALGAYAASDDNDAGAVRWFSRRRRFTVDPSAPGTHGDGDGDGDGDAQHERVGGGSEVAAFAVIAVLRASSSASSAQHLASEESFWENWFARQLSTAPPGLRGGFQTSPVWLHVATEAELVHGAWTSLGLSIVLVRRRQARTSF